jgi:hypothetical protein
MRVDEDFSSESGVLDFAVCLRLCLVEVGLVDYILRTWGAAVLRPYKGNEERTARNGCPTYDVAP